MKMNSVEKIANAVLYEGYVLYPYRPSAVKNQQRFNFGVLYPREYCDLQAGSEIWEMQAECLVEGGTASTIEVKVRFLQMAARRLSVERAQSPAQTWQEGMEREVHFLPISIGSIMARADQQIFAFRGVRDAEGRESETITGELELSARQIATGIFRLTLRIRNLTYLEDARQTGADRDAVLLRSLVSVHSILEAADAQFISMIDPPYGLRKAVAECRNTGTWPVLAGDEGQRNLILSAPIILYDYPRIAPESAGDLCDGTEIDEILALRILTMTDAEKREVRNGDDRARRILERTELLPPEHFQKLHGVLRGLGAVAPGGGILEEQS